MGARTPSPPKASGGWEEDANLDVDAYVAGLSLSDKASRGSSGTGSPAYSNASSGMGSKPSSQGDLRGTHACLLKQHAEKMVVLRGRLGMNWLVVSTSSDMCM